MSRVTERAKEHQRIGHRCAAISIGHSRFLFLCLLAEFRFIANGTWLA
ncbi:hypothetical protein [Acidihalobacter yilgarnensis]|nr:hypothetical protein [Acidihalobacter yilgarnensis]